MQWCYTSNPTVIINKAICHTIQWELADTMWPKPWRQKCFRLTNPTILPYRTKQSFLRLLIKTVTRITKLIFFRDIGYYESKGQLFKKCIYNYIYCICLSVCLFAIQSRINRKSQGCDVWHEYSCNPQK